MERYEWPISGPNAGQGSLRPAIAVLRAIAERNHSRARRRFLRARYLNSQADNVEVWEDDARRVDPSGDESFPAGSQDVSLNLPTYFSPPPSRLDPRLAAQYVKRPCGALESGSTKEPRTERGNQQQGVYPGSTKDPRKERGMQQDVNMADCGIFPSNDDNIRLALAPREIQNASFLPTAGWPPLWDLYGCGSPAPLLYEASEIAGPGALGHRATYNRTEGRDIVSRTPCGSGR